jgi:hypothetical protein
MDSEVQRRKGGGDEGGLDRGPDHPNGYLAFVIDTLVKAGLILFFYYVLSIPFGALRK